MSGNPLVASTNFPTCWNPFSASVRADRHSAGVLASDTVWVAVTDGPGMVAVAVVVTVGAGWATGAAEPDAPPAPTPMTPATSADAPAIRTVDALLMVMLPWCRGVSWC